jgi:hypothetical protein
MLAMRVQAPRAQGSQDLLHSARNSYAAEAERICASITVTTSWQKPRGRTLLHVLPASRDPSRKMQAAEATSGCSRLAGQLPLPPARRPCGRCVLQPLAAGVRNRIHASGASPQARARLAAELRDGRLDRRRARDALEVGVVGGRANELGERRV